MAEPVLEGVIEVLKQQEIFEIYLPFLLTFAIFYGLLKKLKLFGEDTETTGNKIAVLVAVIAAAYVTIFSPAAITISQFFSSFFAQASIFMVTIIVLLMVLGILMGPFTGKEGEKNFWEHILNWGLPIVLLVVIAIFFSSGGHRIFSKFAPSIGLSSEEITLIVLIIITIVIILLVTGAVRRPTNPLYWIPLKDKPSS